MIAKAKSVIANHRFIKNGGYEHRLNIAIVGPNKSGKSSLLRIFAEELIVELVTTEQWKSSFPFILDLPSIVPYVTNFSRFYLAMIECIIQHIFWHRPDLVQYLDLIKKTFDDVIAYKQPPKFPKTFNLNPNTQRLSVELQSIINRLSKLWNNEEGLLEWLLMVLYLPILVAKALHSPKFIYIIDHFEAGDVMVDPTPSKFSESQTNIALIDLLKYVLTQCNFIISCGDQQSLYNILEPNPEDQRQIQRQFEFITTIGLIQDIPYSDRQIIIETKELRTPFIFTADLCGGVPLYVEMWIQINQMLDNVEEEKEEDNEEEEHEENVEEHTEDLYHFAQKVIKILYLLDNKVQKYEIVNVRKKANSQK